MEIPDSEVISPPNSIQKHRLRLTDVAGDLDNLTNNHLRNRFADQEPTKTDWLEASSSKSIIKLIAYYLKMTNPIEWAFILFFSAVITGKIFYLNNFK